MYFDVVEDGLAELRKNLLGYQLPLKEFIPEVIRAAKPEVQAGFFADQLLFCMAEADEKSESQLRQFRDWMYGIIYYLLIDCNPEDQIISSVLKLFELPVETREILFRCGKGTDVWLRLRNDRTSPCTVKELERMISQVLPGCFQNEKMTFAREICKGFKK